ncbi:hypothetical protein OF83DRAFT_1081705, partial [Amylostereum chailletii]
MSAFDCKPDSPGLQYDRFVFPISILKVMVILLNWHSSSILSKTTPDFWQDHTHELMVSEISRTFAGVVAMLPLQIDNGVAILTRDDAPKAPLAFMPEEKITCDTNKCVALNILAVCPEVQGMDYGDTRARDADAQRRKVWLVSSNIKKLRFYQFCASLSVTDILLGDSNPTWEARLLPKFCPGNFELEIWPQGLNSLSTIQTTVPAASLVGPFPLESDLQEVKLRLRVFHAVIPTRTLVTALIWRPVLKESFNNYKSTVRQRPQTISHPRIFLTSECNIESVSYNWMAITEDVKLLRF